jgi:hypothetical protein
MRIIAAAFLTACLVIPAMAQQPAPPPDQSPPSAAAPPSDQPPPPPMGAQPDQPPPPGAMAPGRDGAAGKSARRAMCRDKVRAQGPNGMDRRDALRLCLQEAKLSCLKQAIAQKLTGAARKDFVKNCAG